MKRIVSILLTLAMLLTITPTHAFAASSGVTETVVSARSGIRQPMEPVVLYEPEQTPPDGISYAEVRLPTTVTGEGDRVEQGGPVSVVFHNGEGDEFAPGGELEYLWFYDPSFDSDVESICPVGVSLSDWKEAVGGFLISDDDYDETDYGELQHPLRCIDSVGRQHHLAGYVPEPGRFGKDDYDCSEDQLDSDCGRKDLPKVGFLPPHLESDEAGYGRGHAPCKDAEHGHYAGDGAVNAQFAAAQGAQNHPGGEQPHQHQQEHTEIQKDRVSCDPSAVLRYVLLRHYSGLYESFRDVVLL